MTLTPPVNSCEPRIGGRGARGSECATSLAERWLATQPQVAHARYTQRRRLFLEGARRDPERQRPALEGRRHADGAYQRVRASISRRAGRHRERDAGLVAEPLSRPSAQDAATGADVVGHDGTVAAAAAATAVAAAAAAQQRKQSPLFAGIHGIFQGVEVEGDVVTAIAFARGRSNLIAVASRSGAVALHATDGSETLQLRGHRGPVAHVDFSVVNEYLASGGEGDAAVLVWSVDTGTLLREFAATAAVCAVAFHPANSNILLFGDHGSGIACANISTGKVPPREARCSFAGGLNAAAIDHTGRVVFAATKEGSLDVLHLRAERQWELIPVRSFPTGAASTGVLPIPVSLVYAEMLKDFGGPALMVPCSDRAVRVFSWQEEQEVRRMAGLQSRSLTGSLCCRLVLWLPTSPLRLPGPIAFCGPGSSYAVSGDADGALSLVSLRTLRAAETLSAHTQRVSAVCASDSGDMLASADTSGCVILWGTTPLKRDTSRGEVKDVRPGQCTDVRASMSWLAYDSVAE